MPADGRRPGLWRRSAVGRNQPDYPPSFAESQSPPRAAILLRPEPCEKDFPDPKVCATRTWPSNPSRLPGYSTRTRGKFQDGAHTPGRCNALHELRVRCTLHDCPSKSGTASPHGGPSRRTCSAERLYPVMRRSRSRCVTFTIERVVQQTPHETQSSPIQLTLEWYQRFREASNLPPVIMDLTAR